MFQCISNQVDYLAVAYLLMSIFPVLSTSTSDNKSYLQALRHFYVLATRKKITDCVSIRSNQYVDNPRSPDDSGSCVVYIPRDLGDPAISHSINRSFQGMSCRVLLNWMSDLSHHEIFLWQDFRAQRWIES